MRLLLTDTPLPFHFSEEAGNYLIDLSSKVFTDVRLSWKQKMYRRIESMIPIWQTR